MVCNTSEFKTRIFWRMKKVDLALILTLFGFIIQLASPPPKKKKRIFVSDSHSTVKYLDDMGLQWFYSLEVPVFMFGHYWPILKIYVNKSSIQFLHVFHVYIYAWTIQFIITFKPFWEPSAWKSWNRILQGILQLIMFWTGSRQIEHYTFL